ncbi:ATP synthase F1 subcomplex gamma subunit [Granulicatella balaenopterae]|uniref:ATP synthase gamma chain n=1 Tax=Granulicatella balaenopterae TaxID=137733 RepID=A0A1H9KIQ7_9LACT|nr:F0F1 ATP synthase subunit gamma [Granulicatella balaenopterae]SEQ99031.1 ATP synthase F1 subcomplex gamma subunit [Granulicatella balaenopterae]
MGASLNDIKKRISSTKKTSQITSAMQMVSAAKLAKSEQAVRKYQDYAEKIREVVTHLLYAHAYEDNKNFTEEELAEQRLSDNFIDYHDLLIERPVKKTGYLVISSDQGLAGGYNSSIFQATKEMLELDHDSSDEYVILTMGATASNFFKKQGIDVSLEIQDISDIPTFEEVRKIVTSAVQMFRDGEFDEFYVCYNHHVNALLSNYRVEKMLPIIDLEEEEAKEYELDYIFEPNKEILMDTLLPQYAESLIYGAIIDAKAAEHASRMTAMRSATDNAKDLINDLTQEYNQSRQAQITQEISEIVGGAVALEETY